MRFGKKQLILFREPDSHFGALVLRRRRRKAEAVWHLRFVAWSCTQQTSTLLEPSLEVFLMRNVRRLPVDPTWCRGPGCCNEGCALGATSKVQGWTTSQETQECCTSSSNGTNCTNSSRTSHEASASSSSTEPAPPSTAETPPPQPEQQEQPDPMDTDFSRSGPIFFFSSS